MERPLEELRGGAVPSHSRLKRRGLQLWLAAALGAWPALAGADLGDDLQRVRRSLGTQTQVDALRVRLLERDDVTAVALPPWALDATRGECTTLVLLAPAPTQFLLHIRPWPNQPSVLASSAGALQVTRCGRDRASLLQVMLEMRSPRAVVHALVAVGGQAPEPLVRVLPARDVGASAPLGEPGPAPARDPLPARLQRFEAAARRGGAEAVERHVLARGGRLRLRLAPGCHQLFASQPDGAASYQLELREQESDQPERLAASERGDVRHELCVARERPILLSLEVDEDEPRSADPQVELASARFALPTGLPGRFGPEVAEAVALALGGAGAPRRLGPLVLASLGAQGRTPLPRKLLPSTCYVAVASAVHGEARALSLGVRNGPRSAESTSPGAGPGPRLGFCTGHDGQVELDVEARGLGVAWLYLLFQMGPAQAEQP